MNANSLLMRRTRGALILIPALLMILTYPALRVVHAGLWAFTGKYLYPDYWTNAIDHLIGWAALGFRKTYSVDYTAVGGGIKYFWTRRAWNKERNK